MRSACQSATFALAGLQTAQKALVLSLDPIG